MKLGKEKSFIERGGGVNSSEASWFRRGKKKFAMVKALSVLRLRGRGKPLSPEEKVLNCKGISSRKTVEKEFWRAA